MGEERRGQTTSQLGGLCWHGSMQKACVILYVTITACPRLLVSDRTPATAPGVTQEVCQWSSFQAECSDDEVIVMTRARYGRMRLGQCVDRDMGHLGCNADVMRQADALCSGRRQCEIRVPSSQLEQTRPCYELQNYMEASYKCVYVQSIPDSVCNTCDFIKAGGTTGYISNVVTHETGCGSRVCPWRIEVHVGQRVRITLLDYTGSDAGDSAPGSGNACTAYAVIQDGNTSESKPICSRTAHSSNDGLVSTGHFIDLRILRPSMEDFYLIKYEAVGCAHNISAPSGATVTYDGDQANVKCSASGETWTMTCDGATWKGYKNCTAYSTTTSRVEARLPFGMSVAIIIGVAFIICALVVTIGLGCYKIKRNERSRPRPRLQPTPEDLYQRSLRREEEIHMTFNPPVSNDCKEFGCHCTLDRQKGIYDPRIDYTHIWEAPLPNEPLKKLTAT